MKKFQITLKLGLALAAACAALLALSAWPSAQKTTEAAPKGNPAAAIKVRVSFTIATKKSGCKSGLGICDPSIGVSGVTALSKRQVNGLVSIDGDKLLCEFSGKLPEGGSSLEIEQDIPLSAEVAKKLGVKSASIKAGTVSLNANIASIAARIQR